MTNEDKKIKIKLERHLWPDEIAAMEEKRKKNKRNVILACVLVVLFVAGWIFGSILPMDSLRNSSTVATGNANSKFDSILDIMSNKWYFAEGIDDVSTRLVDQALYGMTTNEEDPHTSYMSAEEIQSFTQSINRNFVGIGVQYTSSDGINMVERVFIDSPAEEAGVQAGDIIHSVDGTIVDGLSREEIKDLVQGDEGTKVSIEFIRQGEPISIEITRREVSNTTYGYMVENGIGYLELYQFGSTTATEVKSYLDEFTEKGMDKLIIDLRDNGGGYLDALVHIASFFLPKDEVVIQQVYSDGRVEESKTTEGQYTNIDQIVILINGNTASASEVLTAALREQRDDVVLVGTTSYGKGTAQLTKTFSDGSALKYTTSKWLTPQGNWVNNVGIEPDQEVKLHEVLYTTYTSMDEGQSYGVDSVSEFVKEAALCLDFLGYKPGRTDGYMSCEVLSALQEYEKDNSMEITEELTPTVYDALISSITKEWALNKEKDTQYNRAIEILRQS